MNNILIGGKSVDSLKSTNKISKDKKMSDKKSKNKKQIDKEVNIHKNIYIQN